MEIIPSFMLDATAIPTIQPRPTARPLIPTTPTKASIAPTAVSFTSIKYPADAQNAIVVDYQTDTGKTNLLANDYPLFRFQPPEDMNVKIVRNIVIHMASFTEAEKPPLQVYLFSPEGGSWRMLEPNWGDNPAKLPETLVYPESDIFIAVRNYGTRSVTIDNLSITLIVESNDTRIVKLGP